MSKKILKAILSATLVTMIISFSITLGVLYTYFEGVLETQLTEELQIVSTMIENNGVKDLEGLNEDSRITWIAADGKVLYDTEVNHKPLENHVNREEVQEALTQGYGEAKRYSNTLLTRLVYKAQRLSDGTVLRISKAEASVGALVFGMIQPILVIALLGMGVSWYMAKKLSHKIVEPLNALDVEHPLENDTYEELTPLLNRIHHQQQQIKSQHNTMRKNEDEFHQIMASMREGLVVLDANHKIVSINQAAKGMFKIKSDVIGEDFFILERRIEMIECLKEAFQNGQTEIKMPNEGKIYQYVFSRIESNEKIMGMVVLVFDVTNKEHLETLRKEFTANVSHELKTPLQGIIGSADLLRHGMVQKEDQQRFIDYISVEASRLVTLVNDILRLSQLDEKQQIPMENFELKALILDIAKQYPNTNISGQEVTIHSNKQLVYEIVRNLVDNGHKYSDDDVTVNIAVHEKDVLIEVIDRGIGIKEEDMDRIFERFYRVDKSHSKHIGGTGLGLSIVKHAVISLHGEIQVDSEYGNGSTFKVTLPIR